MSVEFDLATRLATVKYDATADTVEIRAAIDRANELMRPDDDQAADAGRVLG